MTKDKEQPSSSLQPTDSDVPRHIGIIMDGNRRFAKRLMMKPWKGHEWGAKKLRRLMDWLKDLKFVKELTIYCFSIENFKRPRKEFNYLMDLFKKEFKEYYDDKRVEENKIKIRFIGRIQMFPRDVQDIMHHLMEKTKSYTDYVVNFAMAYGGRDEIVDAARKIAEEVHEGKLSVDQINREVFEQHLYMADEPDMIIRSGGEKRSSNFLNYQSAYSEWFYVEKMWPEFEKEDILACIEEFKQRKRRFGK